MVYLCPDVEEVVLVDGSFSVYGLLLLLELFLEFLEGLEGFELKLDLDLLVGKCCSEEGELVANFRHCA